MGSYLAPILYPSISQREGINLMECDLYYEI